MSAQQLFLILAGCLLSVRLNLRWTENPSNIPARRIILRALPGLILFTSIGFALSVLALIVVNDVPHLNEAIRTAWPLPLLIGFVVLQLPRLKDLILTLNFARKYRFLTGCAQVLDEWSRLYLNKIIDREERKLDLELMQPDHDGCRDAVHRLFEFHLIAIARAESLRLKAQGENRRPALNVFKIRAAEVKFKLFLHYLGYERAAGAIREIAADPIKLYTAWPRSAADRRRGTPIEEPADQRRKYEHAYVEDYVLRP